MGNGVKKIREMGEGIIKLREVTGSRNVVGSGNRNFITSMGIWEPRNLKYLGLRVLGINGFGIGMPP